MLSSQGLRLTTLSPLPEPLDALRLWDGSPVSRGLRRRVLRVWVHHAFLREQMAAVEAERRRVLETSGAAAIEQVRQLMHLTGSGTNGAWVLVMECFAWRACKHRRQVGGVAG